MRKFAVWIDEGEGWYVYPPLLDNEIEAQRVAECYQYAYYEEVDAPE